MFLRNENRKSIQAISVIGSVKMSSFEINGRKVTISDVITRELRAVTGFSLRSLNMSLNFCKWLNTIENSACVIWDQDLFALRLVEQNTNTNISTCCTTWS